MATIRKVSVTLTPDEAEQICQILTNYARANWDHARKTGSAVVRTYAEAQGTIARELESAIVARMYSQE